MAKIFGTVELPSNFAHELLNCEIQIQLNEKIPPQIVMSTLQLYSKGMEYFQSIKSYKFMYFQRKMNNLLRLPKIISSMDSKKDSGPINTANKSAEEKIGLLQIKHKYEKISYIAGQKIKSILLQNEIKVSQVQESIKGQISEQQKRLQLKIERRKYRKQRKDLSTNIEKSTRQSLFNESEKDKQMKIDADFSQIINEDSESETQEKDKRQL